MTVVSLRKDGIVDGSPDPEIAETFEKYAAQARSGEIVAMAVIVVRPNGVVATEYYNPSVWLHHLKSGAATLAYRLDAENNSLAGDAK